MAAAAGLLAFAAFGYVNWNERPPPMADGSSPAVAPDALGDGAQELATGPAPTASGMDYDPDWFDQDEPDDGPSISGNGGQTESTPTSPGQGGSPREQVESPPEPTGAVEPPASVPTELHELWSDPLTRAECLATVIAAFQPTAITIESVDFARFQGRPAVVISVSAVDGTDWVWVSGPGCGAGETGPDLLYQTELR